MRLKLDENMPMLLATTLRSSGHDVHTAADENLLGKSDDKVWAVTRSLARRALQLAAEIDMANRIALVEDERVRIRPPLAIIPPQEST